MPADRRHEPTKRITAPPGSPEYEQQMLQQGQHAMDRAVAMPLTRWFFGGWLLLLILFSAVTTVGSLRAGDWNSLLFNLAFVAVAFVPLMIGAGSVAFTGRSLRPWFIDLIRSAKGHKK